MAVAPVSGYALNNTWDPNFVLASADMITAENLAAQVFGAVQDASEGWVPLVEAPVAVVAAGRSVAVNAPGLPPALKQHAVCEPAGGGLCVGY